MNAPDRLPATAPAPTDASRLEPHVMPTYGRLPIALSHGRGCWLWDTEGKKYLDGLGGIAVNTLGHAHPKLVAALNDQIGKIIHSSNYYLVPLQEQLAAKLCELSGLQNVFFCNSGLEANEAALKIARKFGHDKGIERPEIIVYEAAFHGRSIATLSATGNAKIQAGFGPLVEGFVRVPLNDVAAVEKVAATNRNVVAVFLEVIQGEGGIRPTTVEYLQADPPRLRRARLAPDARRGAMRHGPHRQVVRAPVGRDPPRRHAASPRASAPACRSAPSSAGRSPPASSAPATTARPSAAIRWPCAPASRRCAVMEEEGLLANAAEVGAMLKAGLERELGGRGRRGRGPRPGPHDRHRARSPVRRPPRPRRRRGADDQRHRREGRPSPALADPAPRRGGADRRDPVPADQGIPARAGMSTA